MTELVDTVAARLLAPAGLELNRLARLLGGMLGIALAALHPQLVRTLSLMTAPLFIREEVQQTFGFGCGSWAQAIEKLGVYEWAKKANSATSRPASRACCARKS